MSEKCGALRRLARTRIQPQKTQPASCLAQHQPQQILLRVEGCDRTGERSSAKLPVAQHLSRSDTSWSPRKRRTLRKHRFRYLQRVDQSLEKANSQSEPNQR
eukprot:2424704-Rhodomonas_salina.2